jgi:hypothetical protein
VDEQGADSKLEPGPLDLTEVQRILGRIEGLIRERHVVLVGGQAVVVWFGQLGDRLRADIAAAQVASRDLDLLGAAQDARRAAEMLGGRVHLSHWDDRTPLTGVAIFVDDDGYERRLDVLRSAYGMRSDDIRATAIEVDVRLDDGRLVPVWVMHPERCMESRVHNSTLANKQTDLAWRQLRVSILCARAFSELLLDERGEAAVRDVLNLNERIFQFARTDRCVRLAADRGIEVFDAVLDDVRLPEKFRTTRLPQMRTTIQASRGEA